MTVEWKYKIVASLKLNEAIPEIGELVDALNKTITDYGEDSLKLNLSGKLHIGTVKTNRRMTDIEEKLYCEVFLKKLQEKFPHIYAVNLEF